VIRRPDSEKRNPKNTKPANEGGPVSGKAGEYQAASKSRPICDLITMRVLDADGREVHSAGRAGEGQPK
jgi:hypothetical protein